MELWEAKDRMDKSFPIFQEIRNRMSEKDLAELPRHTSEIKSHIVRLLDHYEDQLTMESAKSLGLLDSLHRRLFRKVVWSVYYRACRTATAYRKITAILWNCDGKTLEGHKMSISPEEYVRLVKYSSAVLSKANVKPQSKSLFEELFAKEPDVVHADVLDGLMLPEDLPLIADLYLEEVIADNLVDGESNKANPGSTEVLIRMIKAATGGFLIGHDLQRADVATIATGIYMASSSFEGLNLEDRIASRRRKRRRR